MITIFVQIRLDPDGSATLPFMHTTVHHNNKNMSTISGAEKRRKKVNLFKSGFWANRKVTSATQALSLVDSSQGRRIYTEEKAKVVAVIWGT